MGSTATEAPPAAPVRGSSSRARAHGVSVVVPAYREAANLPELIARVGRVREAAGLDLELVIVNDESGDGSAGVVERIGAPWARLVNRRGARGLSSAVMAGLRVATRPRLVVMDADLSHAPEDIPRLLAALDGGADFALGSRYVAGGGTDERWSLGRALNSRVATLLARPLTRVRDPMSGFFALERGRLARAGALRPLGYKIGLELLVRCDCRRVTEVPIRFASRRRGESKLTVAERARYLRHLARLLLFRLGYVGF